MQDKGKWIIGDVHGCHQTLMKLIKKLPEDAELVFVGDLIDRGPSSRKVIDFVRDNNYACVMGNHEKMLIDDLYNLKAYGIPLEIGNWFANGGDITLDEYKKNGIVNIEDLEKDSSWLESLPLTYINTNIKDDHNRYLIVTHSSISEYLDDYMDIKKNLSVSIDKYESDELKFNPILNRFEEYTLWNRNIPKNVKNNFFNIFGHTPIDYFISKGGEEFINNFLINDSVIIDIDIGYANIDTGCVYPKERYGKYRGNITAIHFPSLEIIQQENIEND